MSFDWKAFVDLARDLERRADGAANPEAWLRSALSRAYFGAYCHARNYARDFLQFDSRDSVDDHGRLRAHLKGKRRKGDADRLEQLRQWRNDADYLNELRLDNLRPNVASALMWQECLLRTQHSVCKFLQRSWLRNGFHVSPNGSIRLTSYWFDQPIPKDIAVFATYPGRLGQELPAQAIGTFLLVVPPGLAKQIA